MVSPTVCCAMSGSHAVNDCPFCGIPRESAEHIIASNQYCYLRDNPEGALEHGMMIIPFRHVETPFDLDEAEWNAMQPLVMQAKSLLDHHNPDGFNMGWNIGRIGGQEVPHVHLHIFARFADEPFAKSGIRRWFKSAENQRPAR